MKELPAPGPYASYQTEFGSLYTPVLVKDGKILVHSSESVEEESSLKDLDLYDKLGVRYETIYTHGRSGFSGYEYSILEQENGLPTVVQQTQIPEGPTQVIDQLFYEEGDPIRVRELKVQRDFYTWDYQKGQLISKKSFEGEGFIGGIQMFRPTESVQYQFDNRGFIYQIFKTTFNGNEAFVNDIYRYVNKPNTEGIMRSVRANYIRDEQDEQFLLRFASVSLFDDKIGMRLPIRSLATGIYESVYKFKFNKIPPRNYMHLSNPHELIDTAYHSTQPDLLPKNIDVLISLPEDYYQGYFSTAQ